MRFAIALTNTSGSTGLEYWQKRASYYGKKYWAKGSKYEAVAKLQN